MSNKGVTKKLVAAVAAVGAMAMVLSGCGADSASKEQLDANGKPLIKVMFQNATNQDVKTMSWTKDLEKACGCTIEWTQVSDTQWAQQKSATLSAGNPADVTIRGYHPSDAQKYKSFEDLSDDLDKMPNVEKFFKEQPVAKGMVTTPDGKMYTLPRYQGKLYRTSGQHLFINKAWLDKLGLKVPQTWDELLKVMDAFKTEDPNGNGQADEIPYAMRNLDMTGFGWWSPFLFLNSTGVATQFNNSPSRYGFYIKNGKVKNFMIEQEYRDVIEFLHEMIEKGYSPKDSLTQDSSKYYASLTGSSDGKTATVGLAITNEPGAFGDLKDQYEAIEWPASAAGVTAKADFSQDAGAFDDYGVAVAANAPNKDAIFKLINALYDGSTNSITQRYGTIGDWITKDSDTEYTINPKLFELGANDKAPAFMDRFAGWIPDSITIKGDASAERLQAADDVYADQLKAVGDDYFPLSIVPSDEDSTTLSNDNANIMNAALVQSAKWIQDGGLTDDAWNSYVSGLKGLNIEQDSQLWQKWYDEAKKK